MEKMATEAEVNEIYERCIAWATKFGQESMWQQIRVSDDPLFPEIYVRDMPELEARLRQHFLEQACEPLHKQIAEMRQAITESCDCPCSPRVPGWCNECIERLSPFRNDEEDKGNA